MEHPLLDPEFLQSKTFAVDSRNVLPGSVFFALPGNKTDGHSFLQEAQAKGAVMGIVKKGIEKPPVKMPCIEVDDVLKTLQGMATSYLAQKKARCIGITGSVGKTTTKEFLATLLAPAFILDKTPGNANSQIGIPLSILNSKKTPELFIAEMSMSSKGDIASLLSILPLEIAIVTQVALVHAVNFPRGLEDIAEAKAEILNHPNTKKAILHKQVRNFSPFQNLTLDTSFYAHTDADTHLIRTQTGYAICTPNELSPEFHLPFTASHLLDNFLAAALAARELGVSWEVIASQAPLLSSYNMRFETLDRDGILYVNDSYNAAPASMQAALENLPLPKSGGKTIAALGEMLELGIFCEQEHRRLGSIAAKHADMLLCLGEKCRPLQESFALSGKPSFLFLDRNAFKQVLHAQATKGDVVLLKASNSLRLWEML